MLAPSLLSAFRCFFSAHAWILSWDQLLEAQWANSFGLLDGVKEKCLISNTLLDVYTYLVRLGVKHFP